MQLKRKLGRCSLLTVLIVFTVSVSAYGQTESPTTVSASQKKVADSETLKALDIANIRLEAANATIKLLEDRLKAKDATIEAREAKIELRDEQLALSKSAGQDRAVVNTGDARMLLSCENQLARANSEINRLRYPGLLRSIFDMKTITGGAVGFGIGRISK